MANDRRVKLPETMSEFRCARCGRTYRFPFDSWIFVLTEHNRDCRPPKKSPAAPVDSQPAPDPNGKIEQ